MLNLTAIIKRFSHIDPNNAPEDQQIWLAGIGWFLCGNLILGLIKPVPWLGDVQHLDDHNAKAVEVSILLFMSVFYALMKLLKFDMPDRKSQGMAILAGTMLQIYCGLSMEYIFLGALTSAGFVTAFHSISYKSERYVITWIFLILAAGLSFFLGSNDYPMLISPYPQILIISTSYAFILGLVVQSICTRLLASIKE